MRIIGITGPSGSGKGVLSKYMADTFGFMVIDADKVYHGIVSSPSDCVKELSLAFGEDVLTDGGGIDRKRLSSKVFGDKNKDNLLLLNKITHKFVIAEINKMLEEYSIQGVEVCVIDAPLLIEAGINEMCDLCLAVIADKNIRAERIARRDGIDIEAAFRRIESQKPDSYYIDSTDKVIYNERGIDEMVAQLNSYLKNRSFIN